jgi:hypothetical protein
MAVVAADEFDVVDPAIAAERRGQAQCRIESLPQLRQLDDSPAGRAAHGDGPATWCAHLGSDLAELVDAFDDSSTPP